MSDKPIPDDLVVDQDKFDELLRKIANTPALRLEEKKVGPIEGRIYRLKSKKAKLRKPSKRRFGGTVE
jgi:hypothetical protein